MPSPYYSSLGRDESQTSMDMGGELEMSPDTGANLKSSKAPYNDNNDSDDSGVGPSPNPHTYHLKPFIVRSMVNFLGPILVVGFYLFIVQVYIRRPAINGIIQGYPTDPKRVFYIWSVLSVFVLDWAKSGLAGVEAAALMIPEWAPKNACQLIWHTDREWGGPGGWWKAAILLSQRMGYRFGLAQDAVRSRGPAKLWYFLSLNSLLFFIAVPLSGFTMDRNQSLRYGNSKVLIAGVNETTFDTRTSPFIWEAANSRWRQGHPTTPTADTILYAPAGTKNVSTKFYDDAIHDPEASAPISFFSGPQVSERAYGRAWGLLVNVTCVAANPYRDLKLLNVTSPEKWYYPLWKVGDENATLATDNATVIIPGAPVSFRPSSTVYGYSASLLVAGDKDLLGRSDYAGVSNISSAPIPVSGTLEAVLWQTSMDPLLPDPSFTALKSDPLVVTSSYNNNSNFTSYGFGITCNINSTVGLASLDARHRTFSQFEQTPAIASLDNREPNTLGRNPGILAIHTLVLGALGNLGAVPNSTAACSDSQSITCSQWFGANVATGGVPTLLKGSDGSTTIRYPALTPRRFQVAVYKLIGEVAIAMMALGTGEWTGGLKGLEPADDLVAGMVSWIPIVVLLAVWMTITSTPTLFLFFKSRWASTLDGFEMFKLGAQWRDEVHEIRDRDFQHCSSLSKAPGMIGDMENKSPRGFIGLSRNVAVTKREYVYDRDAAQ
ncbi:MAG: hypothetical protein M1839_007519 [Geoglossum umbratile]|nr:MAG: hypothetical protein M1839_007519 [Geoglossum umbratile]